MKNVNNLIEFEATTKPVKKDFLYKTFPLKKRTSYIHRDNPVPQIYF